MKREYGKPLTKEMLLEWGFTRVEYLPENGIYTFSEDTDWYIERIWRKNSSKEPVLKRIKVNRAGCKHKYSTDKSYPIITFTFNRKVICLPLSRVIYAWYIGPIGEREVIDHIDNDPYHNHWTNLQKLSVGENLAKRYLDNPNFARNQYEVKK